MALENLQPKDVFGFFETICCIPHGSGKTDGIVDFLLKFAADRGLESCRDEYNNVIIRKPGSAGYENAPTVILQGHHDMVCEKDEGLKFNFDTDPISPYVDGDWIWAKGTTLGGDDGIAVAMILAILDDDSLPHPPIEALITADEEIGMPGAFGFDCAQLQGRTLINLDSEFEGVLMCSCAGGINVRSTIPVQRETVCGTEVTLRFKGFASGHSGVEIHKGRANTNVLAARLLRELRTPYSIAAMEGGTRETAIAATGSIRLVSDHADALCAEIHERFAGYAREYASAEPNMALELAVGGEITAEVLTAGAASVILRVLEAVPDGVQAMSMDMPGLVQTSANMGLMKLLDDALTFTNTVRSAMTPQKYWIRDKIEAIVTLAGGEVRCDGDYPGWAYNPDSVVKDGFLKAWREVVGTDAVVDAVHAGIECGIFADKIGLDCVSVGPEMADVHTPREHLSISSSARLYEVLKAYLAACR